MERNVEKEHVFAFEGNIALPVYAIGAVLGHCNVVRHAFVTLEGAVCPLCKGERTSHDGVVDLDVGVKNSHGIPNCASTTLLWAIMSNQPDVVRCLVSECGFQFLARQLL